ncbi:phosphodiester glycosidase family protein [Ancrocorticia populi]|uniref:Exopolysaccharide biosynthesis protein n=2 Tax=Ancrocorticia populi TaxID=2175228 RepID=A0A2V1K767_9ACTO|nr:phosphodiester glycosidase family protein [Ancrocorticia populi]PWF26943.1 exopolysaccharide biosynthesis protein [Ancrocorticia populi]
MNNEYEAETPEEKPRKPKNKKVRRAIIGSSLAVSLAVAGVGGWALDRFVIDHVQIASASEYEAEQGSTVTEYASDGTATVTDSTYEGENASITVEQQTAGSGEDTVTYYVATVDLTDATALRSAFANDQFGQSITDTTSNIAEDNDAVFAINGDYYGFRDTGIVIRNGVVYRDEGAREGLAFYEDGTVELYDETATTADELVEDGVWNTLSFGPAIVENGSVIDGIDDIEIDTNFGNHSIQGEQPRTLVGVKSDGTLVFVVVDGRDDGYSRGVTMTEAAELMVSLGCETAYNLDGGGSSTMYFNGEVVNQPSNGSERGTSDILYIEDLS